MENERRKHNYIPFVMELFKICAKKGHLKDLISKAKAIRLEKIKKKEEKKAKEEEEEKGKIAHKIEEEK